MFQSYNDWERHEAQRWDEHPSPSDSQVYDDELALGVQVEPLGFDSIWTVEHHFTPYTMIPNPFQLLTYFAAKTSRVDMGTMVVVLPWHDPIRVVEEASMLDNLLQGRRLRLGVGRGAAKLEFDGLGIEMDTSASDFSRRLRSCAKVSPGHASSTAASTSRFRPFGSVRSLATPTSSTTCTWRGEVRPRSRSQPRTISARSSCPRSSGRFTSTR